MGYNYKICPTCDFFCNKLEKKIYCPKCGSKLIETCPNCGKPIYFPYSKFCSYCGKPYKTNSGL